MELDHTSSILNERLIMFLDYRKPSNELVVDLINRDNPQLPFPIKANECFFGVPTAWSAAGNFRNTEVSVTPRPNSPYIGAFKVRYRRLDIASLIPGGALIHDDWYINNGSTPIAEFLTAFNKRTGMALAPADVTQTAIAVYPQNPSLNSYLTIKSSSLSFMGQVGNKFTPCYPTSLHVPAVTTPLFHWDLVPRSEADPLRRYTTYGHNFSAFSDYLETWSTSVAKTLAATDLDLLNLLDYITTITGQTFDLGADTTPGGLGGAFGLRYVLPEASGYFNSDDYNRCVILYRSTKLTNMPDVLHLHYKV
jgi:hypothetical protein